MTFKDHIAIKIFQRVLVEGRTHRQVANDDDIELNEDAVGRYVKHIRENHVTLIPNFPPNTTASHNLANRFNIGASVVLSGDEPKNIGPVANEAVNIFLKAVEKLPRDAPLRIAVGCGETIRFFSDALYVRLFSDEAARNLLLGGRKIEIMPTAIIPGRRYDTTLPSFLVAQFYSRLSQALPNNYMTKNIHAYVPTLADSFQDIPAEQQIEYYNTTLKDDLDLMRTCQIILLGIGGVNDRHYENVAKNLGLKEHQMKFAHINYQPINKKGEPVATKRQVCGLTLKELAELANDKNRSIIAMAGGDKCRFVESVFHNHQHLPFNYFITDVHIANHLLAKFSNLNVDRRRVIRTQTPTTPSYT